MMNPERWEQIESLFHSALERDSGEREAFLAQACGSDDVLRREVNALLGADAAESEPAQFPANLAAEMLNAERATRNVGDVIGPYQILSLLGKGGMGEVYAAKDARLGRKVAVKLLPDDFSSNPDRVRRFEREARAASALNHPNILTVHEIGVVEGNYFLVTELVEGQTLRQRLAVSRMELSEALEVVSQMAAALAAAHAAGIVHRDIKPENVMLRPDGLVKVLDFGLAKVTEQSAPADLSQSSPDNQSSTEAGVVLGTARYMSPEQARGLKVDARTDIWSLGVVLYELVTGHPPFKGATMSDAIAAILTAEPPPIAESLPEAPDKLQWIVSKALRKEREERYQSAAEMLGELKKLRESLAFAVKLDIQIQPEQHRQAAAGDAALEKDKKEFARAQALGVKRRIAVRFFRGKWGLVWGSALLVLAAILVWAAPHLLKRFQTKPSAITRDHWRFSRHSDLAIFPVWSPDGKFIAHSVFGNENCGIWLYSVEGSGNPFRVTPESGFEMVTDWSPDGRKLMFSSSQQGGGIFVRQAFGGPAQKIAPFGYLARWSADGSKIMLLTHLQWFIPLRARIYLVNPDGSELQEFQPDLLREFSVRWATWHPDGKRITVNAVHSKLGAGFWTIPVNGGAPVKSESTPQVEDRLKSLITGILHFEWSPSGEHLYLTASSKGGWHVWRVTVDPQTLRWVDGPERLTMGRGEDYVGRLSPDGTKLAYSMFIGSEQIWEIPFNADKGELRGEAKLIPDTSFVFDVSADGRELVYSNPRELRAYSFDTGKTKVLVSQENHIYTIGAWAADGSRVALRRSLRVPPGSNRAPEAQYVWLGAEGGEEHPITSPVDPRKAPGRVTDWSRDGQWLLEVVNANQAGKSIIRRLPLAAAPQAETQAQEVTNSAGHVFDNARFSPDGRWVAFNSWHPQEGKEGTIYVVPVGGGPWIPITDGKEWVWHNRPRWSPDGKTLYFISTRTLGREVWGRRFDTATGNPSGAAFQITQYSNYCRSRNEINVKNSGFGVAQNRLILPLNDVHDMGLWMLEDVDK